MNPDTATADAHGWAELAATMRLWIDVTILEMWLRAYREGTYRRQLTRHAYPGQPSTRPQHVPPLCLCTYTLGPVLIDHPDGYDLVFTPHFVIAPECMHHGHLAHRDVVRRMWDDPYGYGLLRDPYDLDDNERKD